MSTLSRNTATGDIGHALDGVTLEQTAPADDPPAAEDSPVHPLLQPRSDVARRMIDATIDAIDQHGEVAVRVQDIVDSVGVQAPILYRNFANREGLVQAAQATRLQRDMGGEVGRFHAAVEAAETVEQFAELVDSLVEAVSAIERRALRWQRINVIGSTYGRPAQTTGWIQADLDLDVFAAWFAGQTLGRILIELGDSGIDGDAWNTVSASAIRHVLLG